MAKYRMECPLEELMGTPAGEGDSPSPGIIFSRSDSLYCSESTKPIQIGVLQLQHLTIPPLFFQYF